MAGGLQGLADVRAIIQIQCRIRKHAQLKREQSHLRKPNMQDAPRTLGEVLSQAKPSGAKISEPKLQLVTHQVISILLLTVLTTIPIWWIIQAPKPNSTTTIALAVFVSIFWLLITYQRKKTRSIGPGRRRLQHSLLAHDRQGFMAGLKLAQKTVIIDGSNLYHFGLNEELGTRALALIAQQLRIEGYRVVCFFDANIHYTLIKNGAASADQRHSLTTLSECFALGLDEIYVVPAGIQADKFILDSLKHLPISFTVTNDRFRDYAKAYPTVMTGDQWRKGVVVTNNEIRIIKHRFASPVYLA